MGVKNTSDGSRNTAWDYVLTSAILATGVSKFLDCQDTFSNASAQFSFPSAPATITVLLEGSMDGVNWVALASSTSVTTNTVYSVGVPFRLLRANVTAFTGGSSPTISVIVSAQSTPYGGSAAGSGSTVVANQGAPNTLANGWPVKVTDGTNVQPTGDSTARPIFTRLTDAFGTAIGAIGTSSLSVSTSQSNAATTTVAAATTTGVGTTLDMGTAYTNVTLQLNGTSTSTQVDLEGSLDNTNFFKLTVDAAATVVVARAVTSTGKPVRYVRGNVVVIANGNVTAKLMAT
jgi:hypothetical protein